MLRAAASVFMFLELVYFSEPSGHKDQQHTWLVSWCSYSSLLHMPAGLVSRRVC